MTTIHLTGAEPLVREIVRAAFPDYKGRKFRLETRERTHVHSSWEGGSRDDYAVVRLATAERLGVVADTTFIPTGATEVDVPPDVAIVRHAIYCGRDAGITIIVHPTTLNPGLLQAPAELTGDERTVLAATRAYKPGYGGDPEHRRNQTSLTREEWDAAKASLVARGLLNRAGAITIAGKNAIGNVTPPYRGRL
jgi:hypothetical protein